ncbi:MAG: NAD(P)H-dependent glycerol-3-phosphate dehydrogenase, partial [Prochlorotrichaceae cyanobacterium]
MDSEDGFSSTLTPADFPSNPVTGILGGGAWGTALAHLIGQANAPCSLWSRQGEASLESILCQSSILVSAISMKGVSETIAKIQQIGLAPNTILVSATKGLDAESLKTSSYLWQRAFPDHPVVVLSGPNLADEIMGGLPAATVVASHQPAAATIVQKVLASDRFRVYTNTDPLGTELGGTLKNVIAIAVGVCDGLKLGTNAKSALMTRALTEIIRVGTYLGAQPETFFGLSGLGDLLATCSSFLSRNYRVGYGLAQGKSLPEVLGEIAGTAEGVSTTPVLIQLATQEKISVPISVQVHRLLQGEITPQAAVDALV